MENDHYAQFLNTHLNPLYATLHKLETLVDGEPKFYWAIDLKTDEGKYLHINSFNELITKKEKEGDINERTKDRLFKLDEIE